MCLLCACPSEDRDSAERARILQLLAHIEHPDALPADAALHLAGEILVLIRPKAASCRRDPVATPEADVEFGSNRRPS